jgi:ribonuclease HII
MYHYELEAYLAGANYIIGIDEAGRGPLAGPLVVSAVLLKKGTQLEGVNDSKQLTKKRRDEARLQIEEVALEIVTLVIDEQTIDRLNIYQATKHAMESIITKFQHPVDYVLVDAMKLESELPTLSIIKGDAKSISIAAASIIAKTTRDQIMDEWHLTYPLYGFDQHKGYGTKKHLEALKQHGPCDIHRKTYEPIKSMIKEKESKIK